MKLKFKANNIKIEKIRSAGMGGFIIKANFLGKEEILTLLRDHQIPFIEREDILVDDDNEFIMEIGPHIPDITPVFHSWAVKNYLQTCKDMLELWEKLEKVPGVIPVSFRVGGR